jgi:hypothetical protein
MATTMFAVLLPVIVGGVIAIAGGLIGPPYLHHLQQKAEKKRKRAEKFEELIATLYEHNHWLLAMANVRLFGGEEIKVVSPMAKVQAISSVYFQEFEKQITQLDVVADKYELWAMEARQKRIQNDPTYAAGAAEAYQPYGQKFNSLLRELREFAKREFQ